MKGKKVYIYEHIAYIAKDEKITPIIRVYDNKEAAIKEFRESNEFYDKNKAVQEEKVSDDITWREERDVNYAMRTIRFEDGNIVKFHWFETEYEDR